MFCTSCGTPNEDGATACRVCGEALVRQSSWKWLTSFRKWAKKTATWIVLAVFAFSVSLGFAIYFYRASQEFEVTGDLLYNNEGDVRPVAGASIQVFEDTRRKPSPNSKYFLLLHRQLYLQLSPRFYDSAHDAELAPLERDQVGVILPRLSKLDWPQWESQRVGNCGFAQHFFEEDEGGPEAIVATTSTNMSGHFWLKLKRGKYFITGRSEVPSFFRLEDNLTPDTSAPLTGNAFWSIPITLKGNTKVVSADPICSPE